MVQKTFSAFFKPYPRFIQKDKTRIWSKKRFSAFFKPYPRFIQKDKMRIWSKKRFSAFFKPYPRFIPWLEIQYSMRFDLQAQIYINFGFA
jgi:hypothetical protein